MSSGALLQLALLGIVAVLAVTLGAKAQDLPFAIHMYLFAAAAVAVIAGMLATAVFRAPARPSSGSGVLAGETKALGRLLFESYLLPFEILSILLLVAMVGVILLSKKELK